MYDLNRFLTAQSRDYAAALREIQNGRKRSHWIWYIFPQVAGWGHEQHIAVLRHLRARRGAGLPARADAARASAGDQQRPAGARGERSTAVFGFPDDLKLRSSDALRGRRAG